MSSNPILVGVDIGGTKTAVVLGRDPAHVLWREQFATEPERGPAHAIGRIETLIALGLEQCGTNIKAIGVSCGGPLDPVQGVIQQPPNLITWKDVPIQRLLSHRFGVPCLLENDANAGAMAEHRFGAGQGCEHMVFLTLGTGLGAGLILNGQLYRGATAMAGELGHIRLSEDGPMGYGKAGSVEGWTSGGGIALSARKAVMKANKDGRPTLLAEYLPNITARDVGDALAAGDEMAAEIVHTAGERLGEAFAILADLLNPQRIVVGGLALRLKEHLLQPARARMREEALSHTARACTVVPAALGEQIGDVAALCVAMNALGVQTGG